MPSFTLAQIGLDHAEQSLCATVLALAGGIEIARWRQIENSDQADLIITNGERRATLEALLETRGNNTRPLIAALSRNPIPTDQHVLHIKRPLTYTAVVTLLQEAENALGGTAHSFDEWSNHFLHPEAVAATTSVTDETPPFSPDSGLDTHAAAIEEAPAEEEPAEEEPAEEEPAEEEPAEEEPAEEEPAEEEPAEEEPAEEEPAEEEPAEEEPAEEVAAEDVPINDDPAIKSQYNEQPLDASRTPTLEVAIDDIEILESLLAKPDTAVELTEVVLADSSALPCVSDKSASALPETRNSDDDNKAAAPEDAATASSEPRLAQVIPLPVATNHTQPVTSAEILDDAPEPRTPTGKTTNQPQTAPGDLFRPARRFVPKLRLLGLIQEIIINGGSYRISGPGFPDILIWPRAGLYQCDSDIVTLAEIFRRPWSEFSVDVAKKQPSPQFINTAQPLIRLRYFAALHGSEGRLMLGVNAQATLKLNTLPDADLLDCTPEQQRLALHLHDYPATLGELATATQTAIATVIDFTNACREIGLLEEIQTPSESAAKPNQRRGLLHRLKRSWQRLHHKSEDTP